MCLETCPWPFLLSETYAYLLFFAFSGPMFLSPLSEFYGRRVICQFQSTSALDIWAVPVLTLSLSADICAFGMFVIWLIPCAVAPNIETMLIVRFLDGLSGSAFLSVAGGTVGDLFAKDQLSLPMMVYTASPFMGPELGPVIGAYVVFSECLHIVNQRSASQVASSTTMSTGDGAS